MGGQRAELPEGTGEAVTLRPVVLGHCLLSLLHQSATLPELRGPF